MSLYRGIYGHMTWARGGAGGRGCGWAGLQYISQLRVTEEYILIYSSVRHNSENI
jgi:hypothetical protein